MQKGEWKEIFKNKIFCIMLALELLLLLLGAVSLFGKTETVNPPADGKHFSLKAGTYMVRIGYTASTETNSFFLEDTVNGRSGVRFGGITLSMGENLEDCELWVLKDTDTVSAYAANGGDPIFDLQLLQITSTHADSRIFLFIVLLFSCMADGLFLLYWYNARYPISLEKKLVWSALTAAFVLVSLPCLVDYNLWGDDWGFHLLRVEGLISGLRDGQFPVRIQGNWLRGYGYAVSIFYSDLFMVIPMLLRLIGFSASASCQMFLVVINLSTLIIAYRCFCGVLKNRSIGAVTAILYTLSTYRIHNIYMRSAIGETLAMIFLPMVLYGFYKIFTEDRRQKGYKKNWLLLTIGLTGIIQSHVLTCEMLAFCILLLCILLYKKVFVRETFFELCKTVAATLLLNLWYLLPFADYLMNGKFNVGHMETMIFKTAQPWGVYPAHTLFLFYGGGTRGGVSNFGMHWTGAFSVGAALTAVFILWLYLEFVGDIKKSSFAGKGLGRLMFGYTALFFVLISCYFPWDTLRNAGSFVEILIASLQFPYRFLSIACLTASVLAGELLLYLKERERLFSYKQAALLLLGIALFFNTYQIDNILNTRGFARVYNKQSMGTIYVSNGEYLPYQANIALMQPDRIITGEGVTVEGYEKEFDTLHTDLWVSNEGADSYVELPILYYRGYTAQDSVTGEYLEVEAGDNSAVRLLLPAGYEGEVHVQFTEPGYWRLTEIISLVTALGCLGYAWVNRKKKRKQEVLHEETIALEK